MEYCYESTKDLENIYYDTSAMADPEVVASTGGLSKVLQVLKKTVLTKPDHVVFGTDWSMCPVAQQIQLINDLKVDSKVEEKIFSLNAISLYKLKLEN